MTPLFHYCMAVVFRNEGGHVSPERALEIADPGGETNYGITQVTLDRLGIDLKPADITREQAEAIYHKHYWLPVTYYEANDPGLTLAMFDAQVQHGRGIKFLQLAVGAHPDGLLGTKTRVAVAEHPGHLLLLDYHARRRTLVTRWAARDARRLPLISGLVSRVDRVLRAAVELNQ